MNLDRLKYRYWQHTDWHDINSPLEAVYCNAVDGCDPTIAVSDFEFCTGLKDKNGKLIYEGDIVSNGYKTGVVKYGEFNCSCCDGVYGWYFDDADIRDVEFYEIVGNIHEQAEQKDK